MDPKDDALRARLAVLKSEHRGLGGSIEGLQAAGRFDPMQLQRLKKRKLFLKDLIARIEDELAELPAATLEHERAREARIELLDDFAAYGLSWTAGASAKITFSTRNTAEAFLRALPRSKALPKLSPDGEGGLMMVWDDGGRTLLVTVDNALLHAVIGAATPAAEYIDDIPFWLEREIPQRILDAISEALTAAPVG